MSLNYPSLNNAGGSVVGATGAIAAGSGFASARTAKGTYTITLDVPVDSAEGWIVTTTRGATPGIISVVHTSDSVKTVSTVDNAGAAADLDFDFHVFRAPF